jgi:hypothetical protein
MIVSEVEKIFVKNFQDSLKLYHQYLIWSAAAASAFFVITMRMGKDTEVQVGFGKLSIGLLWLAEFVLVLSLGIFAWSSLDNAISNLKKIGANTELRKAVLLYPSSATYSHWFFRLIIVVFSPLVGTISVAIDFWREGSLWTPSQWVVFFILLLILWGPYLYILKKVAPGPLDISTLPADGASTISTPDRDPI